MTPVKSVNKIRNYAIASFLVPLIAINLCLFIYKCLYISLITNFEGWFKYTSEIHKYQTRLNYNVVDNTNTNNLFIPSARTSNYGLKLLKVKGPKIWNTIPNGVRSSLSFISFKKLLKVHLLSRYNENVDLS